MKQSHAESDHYDPEQARIHHGQMLLPGQTARQVCRGIRLSWANAQSLHRWGLLSFVPETRTTLNASQEGELIFLGELLAHGCSHILLRKLLRGLRMPYSYDMSGMFYDWGKQRWRAKEDPEEAFYALLERLEANGDRQSLLTILDWAEAAVDLALDQAGLFAHEGEAFRARATP